MSDLPDLPWSDDDRFRPEDHTLRRVRAGDGHYRIEIEPPLQNPRRAYKWTDERVRQIATLRGIPSPEEIPNQVDRRRGECERCGEPGVQNHHMAPKEFFGDEADEYPLVDLCTSCHDYWHDVVDSYHLDVAAQVVAFREYYRRVGGNPEAAFERWAESKDFHDINWQRVKKLALGNIKRPERRRPTEVTTCERCGSRYTGGGCPRCKREDRKGGHVL